MNETKSTPAPLWRRVSAVTIDLVVIQTISVALGSVYAAIAVGTIALIGEPSLNVQQLILAGAFFIPTPVSIWYFTRMDRSLTGQTLGKNLMQCRVEHKGHMGFGKAFLRRLVMLLTVSLIVPLLVGLLNRESRFLHDYAAGTRVTMADFSTPLEWMRATFPRKVKEL